MKIEEIKKIKLDPKDVLLISFPKDITNRELKSSMEMIKAIFPNNKILAKPEDYKIEIITPEDKLLIKDDQKRD